MGKNVWKMGSNVCGHYAVSVSILIVIAWFIFVSSNMSGYITVMDVI